MLESDNENEILNILIVETHTEKEVRHYAQLTLQQCNTFKECGYLRDLKITDDWQLTNIQWPDNYYNF